MEKDPQRLMIDGTDYATEVPRSAFRPFDGLPDLLRVTAFIPGTIISIRVAPGDVVEPGSILLVLDAMKMHNEVCSEVSGTVKAVNVTEGDRVQKDQLLVEME